MEAVTDAVGLRVIGLGPGVLDIIDRQVELVIMSLWSATVFCASISQHTDQADALFCKERWHSIIEQISARNRGLGRIHTWPQPTWSRYRRRSADRLRQRL